MRLTRRPDRCGPTPDDVSGRHPPLRAACDRKNRRRRRNAQSLGPGHFFGSFGVPVFGLLFTPTFYQGLCIALQEDCRAPPAAPAAPARSERITYHDQTF